MADRIRLLLNDAEVETADVSPMTTLLDWLRDTRGLKGTKEGCAEGDCGACTVVVERRAADGTMRREAINACIALMGQLDGASVRTVEGLTGSDGAPHAVQAAFTETDATQCGFCTPGFVMSAFAFAAGGERGADGAIHEALAGNLCRCTGYRPIVEAMRRVAGTAVAPPPDLSALARGGDACFEVGGHRFVAPTTLAVALRLRAAHPDAALLAGATDLGLLASRHRKPPASLIHLARVPELHRIDRVGDSISLGAAASYADATPALVEHWPALAPYLSRLGSRQIRAMGTPGGNLGTASPIGDMPPVFLALGAALRIASVRGERRVAIDEFFLGYRRTALAPDEIIVAIDCPLPRAGEVFHCDKLSKRRDQDISTVAAAYRLQLEGARIVGARVAFGGMAATPLRAPRTEAALIEGGIEAAARAAEAEFTPLDDWRGSADYRRTVAGNLIRRLGARLASPAGAVEV